MRINKQHLILILTALLVLGGCTGEAPANNTASDGPAIIDPTATAVPEVGLTVCLGEAPNTLYPYGNPNDSAQSILHALYDQPVDNLYTGSQPGILESAPTLENGGAVLQPVAVTSGMAVVDDTGQAKLLAAGMWVRPSGCTSGDCAVLFDGNQIMMDQLVVTYKLRPGLTWSDATPLTAHDSVFAYNLNANPDTPAAKDKIYKTASYAALDDHTIVWTGMPGYLDKDYASNFWLPAPQHLWSDLSPAVLATNAESTTMPLGFGPYLVSESASQHIDLLPNPNYYRASEGLPSFSWLTFKIVGTDGAANLAALQAGECDILDDAAAQGLDWNNVATLAAEGQLQAQWTDGNAWEVLNFGITPQSYDDGYRQALGDRPNFFGDVRTRQAVAYCIDRQALVNELTGGQAGIMNTFVPPSHPLAASAAPAYGYDPNAAAGLLDQVGWRIGENGIRHAFGVSEVDEGTKFEISYFYVNTPQNQNIAQMIGQNLMACGIQVNLVGGSAEEVFATGSTSAVFGRQFELAQFSWQTSAEPACHLYLSEAIPGEDLEVFKYGWGGWNLTGWRNEAYDAACKAARGWLPDQAGYIADHQQAQTIFAQELPAIPLFTYPTLTIARPGLCGLAANSWAGVFWNIETWGVCP